MLRWALAFFVIAIVAGIFGFGNIAAGAASMAKILCYIALALMVVSVVMGLLTGKGGPPAV